MTASDSITARRDFLRDIREESIYAALLRTYSEAATLDRIDHFQVLCARDPGGRPDRDRAVRGSHHGAG